MAQSEQEFLDGTLHNVWCITLDVSDRLRSGVPVLFTQNFKFRTRGPDATIDRMVGLEPLARPFGDRAGVVLQRGGAGFVLDRESALNMNFNVTGKADPFLWAHPTETNSATNGFLWPLTSGQDLSGR